jgi:hypothetical protein
MLNLNYVNDCLIDVYYAQNNKHIGNFVMLEDGCFYYQPLQLSGVFSAYTLQLISDKLKELNVEWEKHLSENLSE